MLCLTKSLKLFVYPLCA